MKPQYYIIAFMLLLLSIPQTISSQTMQEQLTGTWTFDYNASINMMSQKSKAHYNKMNTARQSKISTIYKNRKVTFNNDGTYVQVLSDGRNNSSIWTINNNQLEITTPNGNTTTFKIKQLDADKVILNQINTKSNDVNILFTHWYLTKN